MANEISTSVSLSANKSGASVAFGENGTLTMSGIQSLKRTQNIGTSAEVLSFGDITGAPAYVSIKNIDATNYVELATDSGMTNKFSKILAGQVALFPPSSDTIYAKANAAAVNIVLAAVEA